MLNHLICSLKRLNDQNNSENEEALVYQAIAQCCLKTGKKAPYFQFEYEKHLVLQARLKHPDYPIVRLAIITGIDRRRVAKILKGQAFLRYSDKLDLLVTYLERQCDKQNTTKILKRGKFESFEYFCKLAANGKLTSKAMADELLLQGIIADKGKFYELTSRVDIKPKPR